MLRRRWVEDLPPNGAALSEIQKFPCSTEACTGTVTWTGSVQTVLAAMRTKRVGSFNVYLQCERGHVGKYLVKAP